MTQFTMTAVTVVAFGMVLKKFEAAYFLLDRVYPTENTMCFHETDQ